jgi:hypothetical protein
LTPVRLQCADQPQVRWRGLIGGREVRWRGFIGAAAVLAFVVLLACSGTVLARSVSIGHGRSIYLECPGARHITHTNSTHYIQLERPRLVTDAIRSATHRTGR